MEYRIHFCITLFSNDSQKVSSSNMLAEFTIQLEQRIDLGSTDNWGVALCEFSCPPNSGTLKPVDVVGQTNALIYCSYITNHFLYGAGKRAFATFSICCFGDTDYSLLKINTSFLLYIKKVFGILPSARRHTSHHITSHLKKKLFIRRHIYTH